MRRKITIAVITILAVLALSIPSVFAEGGVDGVIRVKISIGTDIVEKSIFVDGNYTAETDSGSVALERQLYTVKKSGSSTLKLYYGSKELCSGTSITLKQHTATEGRNNFIIMYNTHYTSDPYIRYLGDMKFKINSDNKIQAINHIYIEDYLYGVLPYEMSDSFPSQALRAQAVAARNYTAKRLGDGTNYDLTDESANDQVYRGYDPSKVKSINAVNETAGQVLTSGTTIIDAFYSSSNGGWTDLPYHRWGSASAKWPYYRIDYDPYDIANPNSRYETITIPVVLDSEHAVTTSHSSNISGTINWSNALKLIKKAILDSKKLDSYGVNSIEDFTLTGVEDITQAGDEDNTQTGDEDNTQTGAENNTQTGDEDNTQAGDEDITQTEVTNFTLTGVTDLYTHTYDTDSGQDHGLEQDLNGDGVKEPNLCMDKVRAKGAFTVLVGETTVVVTDIDFDLRELKSNGSYPAFFAASLGLFVVEPVYDGEGALTAFNLSMRRFGHALGMSQYGAQQRATSKDPEVNTYDKILAFYYPNTTLETRTFNRPDLTPVANAPEDRTNASLSDTMNVRKGPDVDTESVGKLPKGARIMVINPNPSDAWHKIEYGGEDRYMAASGVLLDAMCTVTFETNGGDQKTSLKKYAGSYISAAPTAAKSGYTLEGWYLDPELTDKVTFPYIVTGDITMYAKWTIATYTISYDLSGGRLESENPENYTIETPEFTLYNPARVGYIFTGWTGTGLSEAAMSVTVPAGSYGNRSYKANWKGLVPDITSAASAGYDSASITWSEVKEASAYELWRATSSSGTYSRVSSQTGTTFTDTGLKAGTTYYYKVRGLFNDGTDVVNGVFSAYKSVKPAPLAPAACTASEVDYDSIKITWSPVSGASGYMLYRSTSENGTYSKITTTSNTYYTNNSVGTGTTYYYKVRAYRSSTSLYSDYSPVASFAASLKPMEGVTAKTYYPTSIKISWNAVPGRTGYEVWHSLTLDDKDFTKAGTTTSTYYNDTGRTVDTTYYYKVRAYRTVSGKKVYNDYSTKVSDTARVFQVTNPKAAMYSVTSNKLTWSSVTGASGYEVMFCDSDGKLIPGRSNATASSTYYYDKDIEPADTHYYKVRAYRTVSGVRKYGDYSDLITVISRVTGTKAAMYTVNSNKISWDSVSSRTGYEVYWSNELDGDYVKISTASTLTSTYIYHKILDPEKTYYYKVMAYQIVNGVRKESQFSSTTDGVVSKVNAKAATYSVTSNKISWSSVTSRTGYEVVRCDAEGNITSGPIKTTTSTYFIDSPLTPNIRYYYRVRAFQNINGVPVYSGYSDVVSAVPELKPVTGPKAVRYNSTKIKLTWYSVSGKTAYEIFRSDTENGTYSSIGTTTSTYYYNGGLTTGKTYYYKIAAYKTINNVKYYGGESAVVHAKP